MVEVQIDPIYNANDIIKVLKAIRDKRATYPSEVATLTRMPKDYVYAIINYLIAEEYIEWIDLSDPYTIDERLAYRRPDMFSRGVQGHYMWRRFNWVGLRNWKLHYELKAMDKLKEENPTKYKELFDDKKDAKKRPKSNI